jgi:phosphatidylglycerophosphate synthase
VKNALIFAAPAGAQILFGRPLLERILTQCERAGIERFFIVCPAEQRGLLPASLGRFDRDARLRVVDSADQLLTEPIGLEASEPCLAVGADVVFARSQLDMLLRHNQAHPGEVAQLAVRGGGRDSVLAVGPLRDLLKQPGLSKPLAAGLDGALPFALEANPDARERAEIAMARALRFGTTDTDGLMAQLFDRKVSWRVSYRLARTAVTPNQVTIANTVLGLIAAWMFAARGYWWPLLGSLLFLTSVTIDGVDGEVARLKMAESPFGKRLDVITDNIVNVAILVAIGIGCYRNSGSKTYVYLLPLLLGGFALCAVAVRRALNVSGAQAERWIGQVERICGRDFAYLVMLLAVVNRLNYVAWGTAFGTYLFAIALWWLTSNQAGIQVGAPSPERSAAAEVL